jgi:hypothetical protein
VKWRVVFCNGLELWGDRGKLHKELSRSGCRIGLPENVCTDKVFSGCTFFIRPLWGGKTDRLVGVILEYVNDPTIN